MKIRSLTSIAIAFVLALVAVLFIDDKAVAAGNTPLELQGDAAAGEKLYRRNCRACHGANGKGASSYPKLVGHPTEYLIDKIVRYRAGEVFGPNTPLMAQSVKTLSDEDIANVAAFVVSLEDG